MEITGKTFIATAPWRVWNALRDPRCLEECLPACTRLSGDAESGFSAKFGRWIGGMPLQVAADLSLTTITERRAARITIAGGNPVTGRTGAEIELRLAPLKGGTRLAYRAAPHAGPGLLKLAGLPLDKVTEQMAQSFLRNFKAYVEKGPGSA